MKNAKDKVHEPKLSPLYLNKIAKGSSTEESQREQMDDEDDKRDVGRF